MEPLELACGVLNQLLCCPKTTAQLQQLLQLLHPLASKQPLSFYFLGCTCVSDHCWSRTGSGSAGCNCQSHNLAQRSGRQQSKDMVSGCREGKLLSLCEPTLGASYPTLPGSGIVNINFSTKVGFKNHDVEILISMEGMTCECYKILI